MRLPLSCVVLVALGAAACNRAEPPPAPAAVVPPSGGAAQAPAAAQAPTPAPAAAAPAHPLAAGDVAPAFSLPGSDGKAHALADHAGKQAVVVAWFPKAFTGG